MKKLPNWELLCYSYIAFRPWNHLERAKHHWNARKAIGTCEALLELPAGHIFSAERSVRADNRSCSAILDFLCVRVLVV